MPVIHSLPAFSFSGISVPGGILSLLMVIII